MAKTQAETNIYSDKTAGFMTHIKYSLVRGDIPPFRNIRKEKAALRGKQQLLLFLSLGLCLANAYHFFPPNLWLAFRF